MIGAPRSVLSMMLKLDTFERKSDARGAYGFFFCCSMMLCALVLLDPRLPSAAPFVRGTLTISLLSTGAASPFWWGHIVCLLGMEGARGGGGGEGR